MPLIATSDTHHLDFFGEHYSLLRASEEPTIEEVFASIRAGRIRQVSPAWPFPKFVRNVVDAVLINRVRSFVRRGTWH